MILERRYYVVKTDAVKQNVHLRAGNSQEIQFVISEATE